MIGLYYAHPPQLPAGFHNSIVRIVLADAIGEKKIRTYAYPCGVNVTGRRNEMVQHFLDTDAEWMLNLDCDMTFGPDLVDRLLAVADPTERPIVGGLYFRQDTRSSVGAKYAPHLYGWHPDGSGLGAMPEYPANTLLQVAATGAGCLLIHRSVLERMLTAIHHPWPWFAEQPYTDKDGKATVYSEDLTFCLRAGALDIPIFVHTGVQLGHIKTYEITELDYQASAGGES